MLGNLISEDTGQIVGTRILPERTAGFPFVEVTFESKGTLLSFSSRQTATYVSEVQANGTLKGDGRGVITTDRGDQVSWRAYGVGRFTGDGNAMSWRGSIFFTTTSTLLLSLNDTCGVFEHESDASGKATSTVYAWK